MRVGEARAWFVTLRQHLGRHDSIHLASFRGSLVPALLGESSEPNLSPRP
jgi:hypothetical protein